MTSLRTHKESESLHFALTTRARAKFNRYLECEHGGDFTRVVYRRVAGGPELAVKVVAPAHHRAVRQQGTRVRMTQSDARRRRDA